MSLHVFTLYFFGFRFFHRFINRSLGNFRLGRQEFSSKAVKMATSTAMCVAPHHSSGMRPPWAKNHRCHKVPPKKPSERYAPIKTDTNSKNS